MTFPATPADGDAHTEESVVYHYEAWSNRWVKWAERFQVNHTSQATVNGNSFVNGRATGLPTNSMRGRIAFRVEGAGAVRFNTGDTGYAGAGDYSNFAVNILDGGTCFGRRDGKTSQNVTDDGALIGINDAPHGMKANTNGFIEYEAIRMAPGRTFMSYKAFYQAVNGRLQTSYGTFEINIEYNGLLGAAVTSHGGTVHTRGYTEKK